MACLVTVRDNAELRAYVGGAEAIYVNGFVSSAPPSDAFGLFVRDDSDTTSNDNDNNVIVGTNNKRWKLQAFGVPTPHFFSTSAGTVSSWSITGNFTTVTQAFIDGRLQKFSSNFVLVGNTLTALFTARGSVDICIFTI